MLLLLSPAKTLDYERPLPRGVRQRATEPLFLPQAEGLIRILKTLSPVQVAQLMSLSDELAALNVARYALWQPEHDDRNSRPAVLAFNGDVYEGLDARSLRGADLGWAQQHLVILSGLYGALRPLDRLQPYRLEMGTQLANPRGRNLYEFWGPRIADALQEQARAAGAHELVNLASQEYFRAVALERLTLAVITPVFKENRGGTLKIVSFSAKRARGAMAGFAIRHRLQRAGELKAFAEDGYRYEPALSTEREWLFVR